MDLPLEDKGWLVYRDDNFEAHIEWGDGRWWLHHQVFHWNHSVLKAVREALRRLSEAMQCDLWALARYEHENPLQRRYMALVGMSPTGGAELDENDDERDTFVMRWNEP